MLDACRISAEAYVVRLEKLGVNRLEMRPCSSEVADSYCITALAQEGRYLGFGSEWLHVLVGISIFRRQ